STAAAGMLTPALEAHEGGPLLSLARQSLTRYRDVAAALRQETGIDIGLRQCGALAVALSGAEAERLADRAKMLRAAGVQIEAVSGAEARQREPEIGPAVVAAMAVPSEAQVEPRPLLKALAIAAERAGARFHAGEVVRGIIPAGDGVGGVALHDRVLETGCVVVAAGSWTMQVAALELPKEAIFPVRGQMVRLEQRTPALRQILFGEGGYVLPRPAGELLCGSTLERVGFRREVTVAGLSQILQHSTTLMPALAHATVDAHWSNFRPATPDGRPLIGALPRRGLYIASGHYRSGILWAPITADILTQALSGGPQVAGADHVAPNRLRHDDTATTHAALPTPRHPTAPHWH
ncbi:MAG: NAD(P)/FAD-dependent oxidoreductase, partial [Polyangiales bacterium]